MKDSMTKSFNVIDLFLRPKITLMLAKQWR
jgi:hypothetical protein